MALALSLRYRRVKEISRWFLQPLLYYSGGCYQQYGKGLSSVPFSPQPIANGTLLRGFHQHRFSTLADLSHEHAPEVDLLSFIKSSLDELEVSGTHHYWLNRSVKNKQFFGIDGIHGTFLVLAASNFECGIMFQKLKAIQERFPHITVMGFKLSNSSDRENLIQLLLTENATFPILLSHGTFPQIKNGACYILFENFKSPMTCYAKDVSLEILYQAIQGLQKQPSDDSKLLNVLRSTSWKQDIITKDQYICSPLQNLLLFYPGCVSADESANRLFISDCNHHRIIVCDGDAKIIDCIGSTPGFEDGDFESAKLRRPAGSYYNASEDCLYFLDSENHAIRRADMKARLVQTLYPTSTVKKGGIWNRIMSKLGLESSVETNDEEKPEVFDSKSLYFPWHLLKSDDDTLYIIDRRFQTLWTMDLGSGKVDGVFEGSPNIVEKCGQLIRQNLSILDKIPSDQFQQKTNNVCVLDGLPHSVLLSSSTALQNHMFICDKVRQRILKIDIESGVSLDFQLSNLGLLGFPYWLNSPPEMFYAGGNGLSDTAIDHLEHFDLLPGKIDIQLSVDVPPEFELVEPLQESCIWRQARGSATEISGMDDPQSIEKVGVAQQWYADLDYLATLKPKPEMTEDDNNPAENIVVEEDGKICITSTVLTSPGTSEVVIFAVLYCKLRKIPNSNGGNQEKYAARILDFLSSKRSGKRERDSWNTFLLQSKGDLRDLIFTKLVHVRVRLNCFDHLKTDNEKDFILTDSSIKVNVLLK
ncbi:uncharacterized protein LOC127120250 isoform X2 [Lathyrus oleraceus]|uniref:uncharacterized protein LOC127120250 isoform X2 n=1 Tax=Pisum sativum TaxID=3888 RepID=UPI0021D2D31A|nr:uncharacterized protein LOC127120250 isoform X2 [Pisum sativum]